MNKTRIVLADDHAVLRQGMRRLIEAEPDMEVVGEAADGPQVLSEVAKLGPDVVVMDLSMAEMGGAEATRLLIASHPTCKVLVLTVHEDRNYLREAFEAGAIGYMLKRADGEELINAIRATANGAVSVDSRVTPKLVRVMIERRDATHNSSAPELTKREYDVLRHIAEGFSNKEIAALLEVSIKSIETYKARGMEKLGINSRVQIVRLARDRKWAPVK